MKVLVTGAFGWTAKAIIEALVDAHHHVVALDLPNKTSHMDTDVFEAIHLGSVEDYDLVMEATQNADAIVHLAVAVGDVYDTPQMPFDINVQGTANLFEAARQHSIKRVIVMSSAGVHLQRSDRISALDDCLQSPEGDFMYDMTKCLQENICRYYGQTFDLTAIVLRAGHIVDGRSNLDPKGRALETIMYCRGGWVCCYDLANSVIAALSYDKTGYDAFHVIGAIGAEKRFDIERTERNLGIRPQSRFEDYLA